MWFSSDLGPDFNGFFDPPTPQNIEKCMGGPSKINKLEFSHMIIKVIGKSTPNRVENYPEIDPNLTKTWSRTTSKICHKMNTKNIKFGLQMGWGIWRKLLPKSTPKQLWNQVGTRIEKTPGNDPQNYKKVRKKKPQQPTFYEMSDDFPNKSRVKNNQDTLAIWVRFSSTIFDRPGGMREAIE